MLKLRLIVIGAIVTFSMVFYPMSLLADSPADSAAAQAQLQQQLLDLQTQIDGLSQQLAQTTAQKNTLANKVKALKKQQTLLNLQIQATNLQVTSLGNQIVTTQSSIAQNNAKSENLKTQMAGVIRLINQNDQFPFLYTAISKGQLSDVFTEYENYLNISNGLLTIKQQLNQTNLDLGVQQDQLQQQQDAAQNLLEIQGLQQSKLTGSVNEQNNLLTQTKGREADYQITINDTKKQAAEILNRLYQLLGVSSQITFGEALKIAQWAQGATGIEPAFLLAILTQESNLGKNVGTCNRPTDPPNKSYKVMMNPTRDIPPFLQITQSLGMDPNITPVSCAMTDKSGNRVGWGGAMGPAQFIPSTWMGYKDKVATVTGHNPANPWDIRDAFAAAAIKLVAGGADGTDQGEWNAAMRYFSGGTNVKYRFYGDNVLVTTAKYRTDIAALSK